MKLSGLIVASALALTSLAGASSAGILSGAFLGKSAGRADAFTNDFLGDGEDRWHSYSNMNSSMYEGGLLGGKSEFRFRSEIITPWGDGRQPSNADRIHAQMMGFGLFNEREVGSLNLKFGAEAIVTGDVTGLAATQEMFHKLFGFDGYDRGDHNPRELDFGLHGQGHLEASYDFNMGDYVLMRPFVGYRHGFETGTRIGADFVLGNLARANHWARDPVSGFLVPAERAAGDALKFGNVAIVAGYDITSMSASELFPEDGDVSMTDSHSRVRLGAQMDIGFGQLFLGAARIGKEFEGQYEDQTVGVVSFDIIF